MFMRVIPISVQMCMAMQMEFFVKLDLPRLHRINSRCGLRKKIKFMGYDDVRKIQIGEGLSES